MLYIMMIKHLKTKQLDSVFQKLKIEKKSCKHHVKGYLVENGVKILPLRYSFGSKGMKGRSLQLFRKSMSLDASQFSAMVSCTMTRDEYIETLQQLKLIK